MKLRVIIVDDEPLARRLVANLLENVSAVIVIGIYGTGKEAIRAINDHQPDILLIDIQLKDMTGFDVIGKIHVKMPLTIFITAFDKYAIEAFNIFAFDYLLKPFTEERFYHSINRGIESILAKGGELLSEKMSGLLSHVQLHSKIKSRIPVPFGGKTVFVNKDDINYILASNYHIEIYSTQSKYVLRDSMYNIMTELDHNLFVRIHRSSIVNLNRIDELIYSAYGEIDVKMQGGKRLRVSRGYRKEFLIRAGLKK